MALKAPDSYSMAMVALSCCCARAKTTLARAAAALAARAWLSVLPTSTWAWS